MPKLYYYTFKCKNIEFIAVLAKSKKEIHIYIGNPFHPQNACVHLEIVNTTLIVQEVAYYNLCSLDKEMKPGPLGTIPMFIGAIIFAKQMFPSIEKLELQDESGFTVRSPNRYDVILSERDMMLYGRTWYQKVLSSLSLVPQTDRGKHILRKYHRRLLPSWFSAFKECKDVPDFLKQDKDFQQASDWHQSLSRKEKSMVYKDWIRIIVREVLLLPTLKGMVWEADLKELPTSWFEFICNAQRIPKPDNMVVQWNGGMPPPIYRGPLDVPVSRL